MIAQQGASRPVAIGAPNEIRRHHIALCDCYPRSGNDDAFHMAHRQPHRPSAVDDISTGIIITDHATCPISARPTSAGRTRSARASGARCAIHDTGSLILQPFRACRRPVSSTARCGATAVIPAVIDPARNDPACRSSAGISPASITSTGRGAAGQ